MGPELMSNFRSQASRFGAEFITAKVTSVDFSERQVGACSLCQVLGGGPRLSHPIHRRYRPPPARGGRGGH